MYNAPPEELSAKGIGGTRQMHNYVSANVDPATIPTSLDDSIAEIGSGTKSDINSSRGLSGSMSGPSNNATPTNSTTYNAYSVPGVLYNTGKLVVPELQRPPPHVHSKLGEDTTIDSIQQKRNADLQTSLPFIAKQMNQIISPEISNIVPPDRYPTSNSNSNSNSQNALYR